MHSLGAGDSSVFKWKTINSHKVNNVIFSSLNQCYDIIICVYWFKLFSQVSDVAHGPLVLTTCPTVFDKCWASISIKSIENSHSELSRTKGQEYLVISNRKTIMFIFYKIHMLLPMKKIRYKLYGVIRLTLTPVSYTHLTLPTICSV